MSFCPEGVPKFPKLGLPQLWRPITLRADLRLKWGLKQSCSLRWESFNNMLHTTYMQDNWGDSWLLVVGSQIGNFIPGPSFGHNLCLKCPNESCELILDIYVPRASNDSRNFIIQWVLTPAIALWIFKNWSRHQLHKVGAHLGVGGFIPSHSPTLPGAWNVTPALLS
jgi:hypothetical protein